MPIQECSLSICSGHETNVPLRVGFDITSITQDALISLYLTNYTKNATKYIYDRAMKLESDLESLSQTTFQYDGLVLRFKWFDSMIVVTYPSLCIQARCDDIDRSPAVGHRKIARHCLCAARSLISLLPDEPSEEIFNEGPWWSLVQYLVRALAVFTLITSNQESFQVAEVQETISSIKKSIHWLQWLQKKDKTVEHAFESVLATLEKALSGLDFIAVVGQEFVNTYGSYPTISTKGLDDTQLIAELDNIHATL